MTEQALTFEIPAIRIHQREEEKQSIYIGVVKAEDFFSRPSERFVIDYYKRVDGRETGYQRRLAPKSVEKIKDYILRETKFPLLPTALLVNSREPITFHKREGNFGVLEIRQQLHIIDGQHRFEAWKSMVKDSTLRREYGNFEFPIVILSNFDHEKEVEQFYVINSRQKRIKTDLAQRNFLTLAGNKSTQGLVPEKSRWNLYATKMVDQLNEYIKDSVWKGKIILPNDSDDLRRAKIISQASFVSSLKPFFIGTNATFIAGNSHPPFEQWSELINNYWALIAKIYPEAIENPNDYTLMKTVGVFSLHLLLARIVKDEATAETILHKDMQNKVLHKAENYLKEASERNCKLDFWRTAENITENKRSRGDYAGAFSSAVGHARIVSRIMYGN